MFNNQSIVFALGEDAEGTRSLSSRPTPRRRTTSEPMLLARLPTSAFIQREAEMLAPDEVLRQLRKTPPQSPKDEIESPPELERRKSTGSTVSDTISRAFKGKSRAKVNTPWKDPQPYEVFAAIEKKDLIYLMEVRDRAFHLLLRRTGDATPLVHAMRIGQTHSEVAIVLLGSFSRWVNQLGDEDMVQPKTKVLLKALRANLKLAIDYGLQSSQSDLIASFLQTLIMSEGEKWVSNQVADIALALRAGAESKPVQSAEAAVRRFATKELGKAQAIAALEDYVANATADLIMMGVMSVLTDHFDADPIPTWYFARDDRVQKAFFDRVDQHKKQIERTASRQTKWQIRVLQHVMEGRSVTFRMKVETLALELDNVHHT